MDPETALILFGSSQLAVKLLGPTTEYLGTGIKNYAKKRIDNIKSIFSRAEKILGDRINEEGAVPPKVLKGIIEDGSYADDEITLEYYGGVLASSWSGISRDDRGATFLALIGRLSTYQLRTHYIMYKIVAALYKKSEIKIGIYEDRYKMVSYMPYSVYNKAMDYSQDEDKVVITDGILIGLVRESLIENELLAGRIETVKKGYDAAEEAGIVFIPSIAGFELFMWSHGYSHIDLDEFFNLDYESELDNYVTINPGYKSS